MTDPSYSQKPIQVDFENFRASAAALAKARAEDVPTYAPFLFGEALALWNVARNQANSAENAAQIHQLLQQVVEKLGQASERAAYARGSFSDLVCLRTDIQRRVWERYHAPEIVNEAEGSYRLAILEAESGDHTAAKEHADTSRKLFREATLRSLERGPIARLNNLVAASEQTVPPGRLQEAGREMTSLQAALDAAKQGDVSLSALRTRIRAGGGAITTLLTTEPDWSVDPDLEPPLDGSWAPGTFGPPDPPLLMRIGERTENSLTVGWLNCGGLIEANKLERRENDGPWELVAEFGPLIGWFTPPYLDTGLQPDTLYCYRVRAENYFATRTTPDENRACGFTRIAKSAAPFGLKVWRIQLHIRTADVSDAGTDDSVRVRLNSPLARYSPNSNWTQIHYPPHFEASGPFGSIFYGDFDRGHEFYYDLNLRGVKELSDISLLSIVKEGTDALGIAEISLLVNEKRVFEKYFGETASTCLWINEGDGHSPAYTVSHAELRAHPMWQNYVSREPFPLSCTTNGELETCTISNSAIVSILESMIGELIDGTNAYWAIEELYGPAFVEATRVDNQTLHIDLDLSYRVGYGQDDPEIDIDFDLCFEIECNEDTETASLRVTTRNFNATVDLNWETEFVLELAGLLGGQGLGLSDYVESFVAKRIENNFQPIMLIFEIQVLEECPRVEIDEFHDLKFIFRLPVIATDSVADST